MGPRAGPGQEVQHQSKGAWGPPPVVFTICAGLHEATSRCSPTKTTRVGAIIIPSLQVERAQRGQ